MKIEIITTGDELMSGLTQDSNFRWAAEVFFSLEFNVEYHTTVGDLRGAILSAFRTAETRADVVIVTGGLGPTPDDLTVELAAEYFGASLEFNQAVFKTLEERLMKRGRTVNKSNKKQAYLPSGSVVLKNHWGTAPGFNYERDGTLFYFLPGVPIEFQSMMREYVLPDLGRRYCRRVKRCAKLIKTFGLPESELAEMLKGIEREGIRLGYRSHFPEVHLRVSASSSNASGAQELMSEFVDEILMRLGDSVFTTEGELIEEVVGRLLCENNFTLATAESCTGGLLSHRITNVPGSSSYFLESIVSYSNESKSRVLKVPVELIDLHGAVSAPVVEAMAAGVRKLSGADLGVGISGIAGPDGGTVEKPVGTVFIGMDSEIGQAVSHEYLFHGDRERIKLITVETALNLIRKNLIIRV